MRKVIEVTGYILMIIVALISCFCDSSYLDFYLMLGITIIIFKLSFIKV